MALSPISLARLQDVYQPLAERIIQMDKMAPDLNLQVTQGLRTWEEQDALYAQGRTSPGKIVTNARGGSSWHNFGVAVDVVPEDATGHPDWNTSHPSWDRIVECGLSLGLVSGSAWRTFPDWPHFQLTGRFGDSPTDEVRVIYKYRDDIRDVWVAAFGMVSDFTLGVD